MMNQQDLTEEFELNLEPLSDPTIESGTLYL